MERPCRRLESTSNYVRSGYVRNIQRPSCYLASTIEIAMCINAIEIPRNSNQTATHRCYNDMDPIHRTYGIGVDDTNLRSLLLSTLQKRNNLCVLYHSNS